MKIRPQCSRSGVFSIIDLIKTARIVTIDGIKFGLECDCISDFVQSDEEFWNLWNNISKNNKDWIKSKYTFSQPW